MQFVKYTHHICVMIGRAALHRRLGVDFVFSAICVFRSYSYHNRLSRGETMCLIQVDVKNDRPSLC